MYWLLGVCMRVHAWVYLLWLISVGQRRDHPDDVQVIEGGARGEGAGQDGRLAPCHLDAALTDRDLQRLHTHYRAETGDRSTTNVKSSQTHYLFNYVSRDVLFIKTYPIAIMSNTKYTM